MSATETVSEITGDFQNFLAHGNVSSSLFLFGMLIAEAITIDYLENKGEKEKNIIE